MCRCFCSIQLLVLLGIVLSCCSRSEDTQLNERELAYIQEKLLSPEYKASPWSKRQYCVSKLRSHVYAGGHLPDELVEKLIMALEDDCDVIRWTIVRIFGKLDNPSEPVSKALLTLLSDPDQKVRTATSKAIVVHGIQSEEISSALIRMLVNGTSLDRTFSVNALRCQGLPAIQGLVNVVSHSDSAIADEASYVLSSFSPEKVVPLLSKKLEETKTATGQANLCYALGAFREDAQSALSILEPLRNADDMALSKAANWAIQKIASE